MSFPSSQFISSISISSDERTVPHMCHDAYGAAEAHITSIDAGFDPSYLESSPDGFTHILKETSNTLSHQSILYKAIVSSIDPPGCAASKGDEDVGAACCTAYQVAPHEHVIEEEEVIPCTPSDDAAAVVDDKALTNIKARHFIHKHSKRTRNIDVNDLHAEADTEGHIASSSQFSDDEGLFSAEKPIRVARRLEYSCWTSDEHRLASNPLELSRPWPQFPHNKTLPRLKSDSNFICVPTAFTDAHGRQLVVRRRKTTEEIMSSLIISVGSEVSPETIVEDSEADETQETEGAEGGCATSPETFYAQRSSERFEERIGSKYAKLMANISRSRDALLISCEVTPAIASWDSELHSQTLSISDVDNAIPLGGIDTIDKPCECNDKRARCVYEDRRGADAAFLTAGGLLQRDATTAATSTSSFTGFTDGHGAMWHIDSGRSSK